MGQMFWKTVYFVAKYKQAKLGDILVYAIIPLPKYYHKCKQIENTERRSNQQSLGLDGVIYWPTSGWVDVPS